MTPAAILALVKDGLIIIAVIAVGWFLVNSGKNMVHVEDIKKLEQRIEDNAKVEQTWRDQKSNADDQLARDIKSIPSVVAGNTPKPPVWLCNKPSGNSNGLPANSGSTASNNSSTGGTDKGSGSSTGTTAVDRRPAVNAVETKYETAFAECRSILAKWPKNPIAH